VLWEFTLPADEASAFTPQSRRVDMPLASKPRGQHRP